MLILTLAFPIFDVQASTPHETFFSQGIPTADQIRSWSALPGTRSFIFAAKEPFAEELKPVAQLKHADRVVIEVTQCPSEDSLLIWKSLASQGVDLVILAQGIPGEDEIQRLNEAGFTHVRLAIAFYPGPEDAARLGKIKASVALTFVTRSYPRYEDKPGLLTLPARMPFLFVTDYWPAYSHMDLLNMLPQPRTLRVMDMLPPDESLDYIRHIQRLQGLEMETRFDPAATDWNRFEGLPLTWTSKDHVPSAQTLQQFSASGNSRKLVRKLVIDQDAPLSAEEHARLEASPLPVEWIHAAGSWR